MVGSRASPFAGTVVWITGAAVVHEHDRVMSYMKRHCPVQASEKTPVDYSVDRLAQKQAVAKNIVLKCDAFTKHCRRHLPLVSLLRQRAWRKEETCLQQVSPIAAFVYLAWSMHMDVMPGIRV